MHPVIFLPYKQLWLVPCHSAEWLENKALNLVTIKQKNWQWYQEKGNSRNQEDSNWMW